MDTEYTMNINAQTEEKQDQNLKLEKDLDQEARNDMFKNGFEFNGLFDTSGELVKFNGRGGEGKKKEKTEWYKAERKNGSLQVTYNSHHNSLNRSENYVFYSKASKPLTDEECEAEKKRVQELQEKRKKDEEKEIEKKRLKAVRDSERFNIASKTGLSPYLERKQVGAHGLRFDDNLILIPMIDLNLDETCQIQCLQEIYPEKKLFPDSPKLRDKNFTNKSGGLCHVIGELKDGKQIRVSEGYATSASVFESTGCSVPHVTAFSAGNYKHVIPILKERYPNSPIIICADNNIYEDKTKKNVGLNEAYNIAKKYNCDVVFPVFPEGKQYDNADFNDLMILEGKEAVRNCFMPNNLIFKSHSYKQLLELPPKKWLLDKIFGEKEIGMIYGDSGTGKTFVVIDMIICLCVRKIWARTFEVTRPLTLAYCCGEGISGLPERLRTAVDYYELDDIPNFHFFDIIPQLFDEKFETKIKKFVDEWKILQSNGYAKPLDVLFIDTFHTATVGADDNSSKEMGIVLNNCRYVNRELGCTVIIVHHTTKSGESYRGSGSIKGGLDFSFEVENAKSVTGYRKIRCEKVKDAGNFNDINFRLQSLEDHKSVYVEWIDFSDVNQDESSKRKKTESCKNEILAEMKRNPTVKYTSKLMAPIIGQSPDYTRKLLDELNAENKCLKSLDDQEKKASKNNPYIYKWIEKI